MADELNFITENTKININEPAFEDNAKELICELFIEYVNGLYQNSVIEQRNIWR